MPTTPPRVVSPAQAAKELDHDDEMVVVPDDLQDEAVGPQSPLGILRGKRADLQETLFLDLQVPRWDDIIGRAIWVRYRPGSVALLNKGMERRKDAFDKAQRNGKGGDPDWLQKANADMLVEACVAVYDLAIGEEPPTGALPVNLPTFGSRELSEALDSPGASCPRNAVGTCMYLYGTPDDVLLAADQLLRWSGQASKEADRSFLPQ
jgi:hypothetical protein